MKLSEKQLKKELDKLARASTAVFEARRAIDEHALAVYGVEPGDVDNDAFIDACAGGSGSAAGMTPAEFDESMKNAIQWRGSA